MALRSIEPGVQIRKFRYDVFISYAHEDEGIVRWLAKTLRNYWVPFRRRRSVFLDHSTLAAGQLRGQIVEALHDSRFLLVCASSDARRSDWVDEEIRTFRLEHGDERLLSCRVGALADQALPSELQPGQFIPDLRGDPTRATGKRKSEYLEQALALLAPILGFRDKNQLTDTVLRRRHFILWASLAVTVAATLAFGAWQYWLNTPMGLHHVTTKQVLRAADTNTIDTPEIVSTARVLAKQGRSAVEHFAGYHNSESFRPLTLAAGYASLDPPDCLTASQALSKLDAATAELFPEAVLITARRCDLTYLNLARGAPKTSDERARWGLRLAQAGLTEESRRVLTSSSINGPDRLRILVELQAQGMAVSEEEVVSAIGSWSQAEADQGAVTWELLDHLKRLDLAHQLESHAARSILEIVYTAFSAFTEDDIKQVNSWARMQQLAAHLVAGSNKDLARGLLDRAPDAPKHAGVSNEPAGWAWRALALDRLSRSGDAKAAFEKAEQDGLASLPMSRDWSEWRDILETYALANRWREAFRSTDKPGNGRRRLELKMRALELWAAKETGS